MDHMADRQWSMVNGPQVDRQWSMVNGVGTEQASQASCRTNPCEAIVYRLLSNELVHQPSNVRYFSLAHLNIHFPAKPLYH
jgi:hypothetical protein